MNTKNPSSKKILAQNKRARFDYEISKSFVAGMVLRGYEVKSVRNGNISLKESFVRVERGEVWLINAHISKWKFADITDYDPRIRRKLLLTKREVEELRILQDAKKMAIIPLEIFSQNGKLKVKIGAGKGRKKYDKRKKIKEREMKRQVREDIAGIEKF
ncbi:SsrA-binding protein SmpB [Candidatus Dojkabacteria bacterium]|nr:SsrA-binding protein SmpB [Candidatus Dojkabacteria bacterium]